jgi:hypothetical protein
VRRSPFFRFREFAANAIDEEDPEEGNLLAEWYIGPLPESESEVSKAWLAAYDQVCPPRTEGGTS